MTMTDSVRTIDLNSFSKLSTVEEKLKFLLRFGILAPSSHNSQPWKLNVTGNKVFVRLEQKRRLPVGDPKDRQAFVSIGCCVENIMLAGEYFGLAGVQKIKDTTVEITFALAQPKPQLLNVLRAIQSRSVNRFEYSVREIEFKTLSQFTSLDPEIDVKVISGKKTIDEVSNIILGATYDSLSDSKFKTELSHYIIPSFSFRKIGMPGFAIGVPFLVSFLMPFFFRNTDVAKKVLSEDTKILKDHTPHYVLISTKNDDVAHWVKAGEIAEKLFLLAETNKLAVGIWAAPIEVGDYSRKLAIAAGTTFTPQVLFRMGYPLRFLKRRAPRLDLNAVYEHTL